MRILFLTEGTHAPSSRFRVQQFIPHFERLGLECKVVAGYGPSYNRIAATRWGTGYKLAMRGKRFLQGLDAASYDLLFIQRPIFPFSPLPERVLQRLNPRIVFDVDDAVFLGPDSLPAPRRQHTFDTCVQLSKHYIAGNQYLANNGRQLEKTSVVPTVIDTDLYTPRLAHVVNARGAEADPVVIGWIGSPTTLRYVDQVLPALRAVRDRHPNVIIRIVCSEMPAHLQEEERFEFVPWSKATEIASIQSFDIGIMPMEDTRISLGKCGFKMIQYMSVGIPVVASPIGANREIFAGSDSGELATTHQEWLHALGALVTDSARRARCGAAAREHAVKGYSIHAVLPRYLEIFETVSGTSV